MQCPRCQHPNPAGVKFCGECGARLELLCSACRAANPPPNKFCLRDPRLRAAFESAPLIRTVYELSPPR